MVVAIAAVAVVSLLAAGCDNGRRGTPSDVVAEGASTPRNGGGVAAGEATFGTIASPCGPGDATGATDQGITDTRITIGYGDDAGYPPAPGLNHQMSDAVKAFIAWCDDQGGINGRRVAGNYHDAAITEVNNAIADACKSDFFLVGEGFSLDASQEEVRRACGLPAVPGFAVSPQFANAPLKWEPSPVPADYTNASAAAQLKELFPEAVTKAAVMYGNYSATIDSKDKVLAAFPDFGWNFLSCPQQYNIQGESDWRPFLQKLDDCGAELVYFVGSPYPMFENVLTAADQLGYHPIWYVDVNFYEDSFRQWNTTGYGNNVYVRNSFIPLEEASSNPATQKFLDIMGKYGGDPSQLGEQAASAFLLWATAAQACGSDLTRQCVADHLNKITTWTGGGLHAEANPGQNLPGDCGLLMKLEGKSYARVAPTEPGTYTCDPSFAAKVTGPALERAHLDDRRIAQL